MESRLGSRLAQFFRFSTTRAYLVGVAFWAVVLIVVPMEWYVYVLTLVFGLVLALGAAYCHFARPRRREAMPPAPPRAASRRSRRSGPGT